MKKVYTLRDIEEIEANGGNYDSLPPQAILTPSARDAMNAALRKRGASPVLPSVAAVAVGSSGTTGKVPIHDPIIPDYEYSWSGPDAKTPAEIERFFYSKEISVLKERIVAMGQRMWSKNYVDGNGGNITIRVGDNLALCTPTLISKGFMAVEDICLVDLDGNQKAGKRARTSEAKTHFAIMKQTAKAKACVHAHPPHATAFAVNRLEPPTCLIPEAEVFLGKIGIARYETPGTPENAQAVGELAETHQAILMANHGVICWGKDVEDAYWKMENTEAYCQTVLIAMQLGGNFGEGYGAKKLKEIIGIRESLGMDDYRTALPDCELCDNSHYKPGAAAHIPEARTEVCTISNQEKNPQAEAVVEQMTKEIMSRLQMNDGLPD